MWRVGQYRADAAQTKCFQGVIFWGEESTREYLSTIIGGVLSDSAEDYSSKGFIIIVIMLQQESTTYIIPKPTRFRNQSTADSRDLVVDNNVLRPLAGQYFNFSTASIFFSSAVNVEITIWAMTIVY